MDRPNPRANHRPNNGASNATTGARAGSNRRRIAGERTRRPPSVDGPRPIPPLSPTRAATTAPITAAPDDRPPVPATTPARPVGTGPSNLVLAVLAVLAAAAVATAAYFAVPAWRARAVQETQRTAPAVAERAAKAILSYDYRSLTHDENAAASYLTPSYRTKYRRTFERGVKPSAPRLHAKVTAQVLGSGIAQADADRAHVLLFVDQTTRSKANPGRPQVALNRVMLDLVHRRGAWLVNGITAY